MFFTFLLAWLIAAVIIYLWCYVVEVVLDLPVTGQTPCTAHASLKNIIRRVLRDASNIAILKEPQNEAEPPETTTNRTYEDLLATAILNKVIDNYQTDLRRSSSGSSSSKRSDTSKRNKHRKYEEERWRSSVDNPDLDNTSVSSVEEWCRSDSSCGSKYVDHMSFSIQQSIEEITTSDEDHPNNQYLHTHNLSKNSFRKGEKAKEKDLYREDWQDNWLFSRKGKGSPKPVPVPMLVPNPSTDFRALIGDRDAEDTTDLSETGSDIEETDSVQDIKTILIDSRTVIGGKNLLENITTEYEEEPNQNDHNTVIIQKTEINMAEEASKDSGVDEDLVSEARNNILIHETPYVESDSLSSNTEKDMEYTEKYASIPRQISKEKKSPMPSPRTSKNSINEQEREKLIQQNNKEQVEITKSIDLSDEEDIEEVEIEAPIVIQGSYSEKEKEKWKNPIALTNNPYSKENLDKRLSDQSNNDNHLFGRDYYIREAKRATGGRKKFSDEDESTTESSGHDFDQESLPVIKDIPQKSENIYVAIPAIIKEEDSQEERDEVTDLESVPSSSRPVSLALSSDSEDIKVYNIETGKVSTYKNRDYTKEIIENSKSPEGSKSFISSNELISPNLPELTNTKFDENQNHSTETNREPIMNISKLNHIINLSANIKPKPTTPITKKEFLMQQISYSEPEIEIEEQSIQPITTSELKDVSKKYLQSLVRSSNKTKNIIDVSSPLISLQEFDNPMPVENKMHVTSPVSSIEIEEDIVGNLIDIEIEDISDPRVNNKSCIDLRFIGQNNPIKTELSPNNSLLTSQHMNGYASSTPNLSDEKLYYSDSDENVKETKTSDLDELSTLMKPSVRDLKKLFDQDKSNKVTLSRSKSNLTTKPEIRAHRQIHSLTARSLPKEYRRDILPELQNSTTTNNAIIEKNDVEGQNPAIIEEEEELQHIPPCKSKIDFFEKLKK